MKIGSCLLLLATQEDPLAAASVPLVAASGYDYAEVSLARIYDLSSQDLLHYRSIFEQNHLPVEVFNNAVPRGFSLIGPSATKDSLSAYIHRAIALSHEMGVQLITMSGPNRRSVPDGFTWEEGFPQYITFLKMFSEAAEAANISLAIEPINHEEHGFIATIAEARRAVEAVGNSNLGIIVDTYHFAKENDSTKDLLAAVRRGYLFHIHHATPDARSYPQNSDFTQTKETLLPLLEAGYRGRISIEAHAADPERELSTTLHLMHTL